MANSHVDLNHTRTIIGVNSSDGVTIVTVAVDPATHALQISNGVTGSDLGPANSLHDDNHKSTLMGVSSSNFTTPVAIYVDTSHGLLTKST